jgi:hypothetical protein
MAPMVWVLPVPAGPTSTSTQRPEIKIWRAAPAWSSLKGQPSKAKEGVDRGGVDGGPAGTPSAGQDPPFGGQRPSGAVTLGAAAFEHAAPIGDPAQPGPGVEHRRGREVDHTEPLPVPAKGPADQAVDSGQQGRPIGVPVDGQSQGGLSGQVVAGPGRLVGVHGGDGLDQHLLIAQPAAVDPFGPGGQRLVPNPGQAATEPDPGLRLPAVQSLAGTADTGWTTAGSGQRTHHGSGIPRAVRPPMSRD